jgi:hypothetical protein
MAILPGQPEIRFNKAGPYSIDGVSPLPKTITIKKTCSTALENEDFWVAPAGTLITHVYALCLSGSGNTTTQVGLGQDGSTQSLITFTAFSMQTTGNFTNYTAGLYLPAGDTIRISVTGTPAASTAYFAIQYFDTAAMQARGVNVDT